MAETKKKGFNLAEALRSVPESGTGREQIEYIDISLIDSDPNNFYELSGVDELASNIALCGLMDPIRVRTNPDDPARVIIVSGHRRRAAIEKLVQEGREDLKEIPCIRAKDVGSALLQELQLIYANSDTRKMTDAEISKQTERVEMLLYQLKEEGHPFPGRMRDNLAAVCKISKTKLSNLKVIREGLEPNTWKLAWEAGKIAESVALVIARLPAQDQLRCWQSAKKGARLEWYREQDARRDRDAIKAISNLKCPDGGTCQQMDQKFECHGPSPWRGCAGRCCGDCSDLGSCEYACPKFYEQIKQIKADKREERKQARLAQEAKDRPDVELITALWARFAEAREAAGLSIEEYCKKAGIYTDERMKKAWPLREMGGKITRDTGMPYRGGNGFSLWDIRPLLKAAKALGVSLDYLLLRTDDPKGFAPASEPQATGQLMIAGWMPGGTTPTEPCDVLAVFDFGSGKPVKKWVCWNGSTFTFPHDGAAIDVEPIKWLRLPPDEEAD